MEGQEMSASAERNWLGGPFVAVYGFRRHGNLLPPADGERTANLLPGKSMNLKYILGGTSAATLIGALVYFYGSHQVPVGQPLLQSLTPQNVAGIRNAFNAAQDDVRVVVLLSPT
jgi:hypothetical protein